MTLEEVKKYLRVDDNEEDDVIQSLIMAADSYLKKSTGKLMSGTNKIENDELYNMCLKLLIAHWYENRGVEIAGNLTKISHSVDALINHISMCGDYT